MVPTLGSLAGGMDRADTLWYHMPLAARFVQTGELGAIFYFDPIFFASFYPANSEVLHAVPILAFDRDIVSPLLNLGFLALGLLASCCVGRPYGVGPQALIGGAIALGAQSLVEFQAGEALNDITGVAFVLGCGRDPRQRLRRRRRGACGRETPASRAEPARTRDRDSRAALAIAGIAAGIAAGIKLSFLAPVLALTVGVVVIAGRGGRLRTALWFASRRFAAGGYWYVRNLIADRQPDPVHRLARPDRPAGPRARLRASRPGFSVAHYWNDPDVWRDWFVPGSTSRSACCGR